jgi:putative toxin-antitoxin system antitoxin component (TIGR02293 family)
MYGYAYVGHGVAGLSQVIGVSLTSETELIQKVQDGLSFTALEELGKKLNLSQAAFLDVLDLSRSTYHRRKEEGRLTASESDLVVRIAQVVAHTEEVFEPVEAAQEWLTTPISALLGKTPLQFSATERGANYVHIILSNLEAGNFFA